MGQGRRLRGWLLAGLACGSPALAWAPEARVRQVEEAVRLLPASLRLALERHREALLRGALEPLQQEDQGDHLPPAAGGTLDRSLEREVAALLELLDAPSDFKAVARGFGRVAHYAADAGFPPGAAGPAGRQRYRHFADLCKSRSERFPVVFYGHDDPALAAGDFRGWSLSVMERARREDGALARAYAAAGDPPAAWAFDDRSVPFAVGSLAYSRTITDTARVWLALWQQAGGDTGRTPYRRE
jgi:hypothetical protein